MCNTQVRTTTTTTTTTPPHPTPPHPTPPHPTPPTTTHSHLLLLPLSPRPLNKTSLFLTKISIQRHDSGSDREEERKKKERKNKQVPSTIARTRHFCCSRAWNPPHSDLAEIASNMCPRWVDCQGYSREHRNCLLNKRWTCPKPQVASHHSIIKHCLQALLLEIRHGVWYLESSCRLQLKEHEKCEHN